MSFQARYFDGKSSIPHDVEVDIAKNALVIYLLKEGEPEALQWYPEKIHANEFTYVGPVVLKYGDFPFQYIEVTDSSFSKKIIQAFPEAAFHQSAYSTVSKGGWPLIAGITGAVMAFAALFYFYILPFAAEHLAGTFPREWEEQLGENVYRQLMLTQDVSEEKSYTINLFFKELHYRSKYNIEVYVVKSDMVNAFALPGGKIVVFEGILDKMKSYHELAALLGHEVSHIELKHTTRNIFRTLAGYMFISILFGDASGVVTVVADNANAINNLSYSRDLEREADSRGIQLMKKNNIDPVGMENLFKTLKEKEDSTNIKMVAFLSTHPVTDERISNAHKETLKRDYTSQSKKMLETLFKDLKEKSK